jgi:hypothetical protein
MCQRVALIEGRDFFQKKAPGRNLSGAGKMEERLGCGRYLPSHQRFSVIRE